MTKTTDISWPSSLVPKSKYFDEVGDTCINTDAAIMMIRAAGTPQSRFIESAFRRELAKERMTSSETPEKQRENALFKALESVGIKVGFTHIKGTME
jgi:hypothetical protein